MGYICADRALSEITGGGNAALVITVEVPEGWCITHVAASDGAEGMTVTVGMADESLQRACILLDGSPGDPEQAESPVRLLCVTATWEGEEEAVSPCTFMLLSGDDSYLFYADQDGTIKKYPYSVRVCTEEKNTGAEQTGTSTEDPEHPDSEEISESERETARHTHDPVTETMPDENIEPDTEILDIPIYIGCQETPVRDGQYAVRFLFCSEEGGAPVVCMEGGGLLTVEITYPNAIDMYSKNETVFYAPMAEKQWSVCTFRGLSASAEYVFFIFTKEKTVRIMYCNGLYLSDM